MSKYFTTQNVMGIAVVILAIAFLLLHRKAPSTISTISKVPKDYPSNPVNENEPQTITPDYMRTSQPSRIPAQQIDLSQNILADSMSLENYQTAIVHEFEPVL